MAAPYPEFTADELGDKITEYFEKIKEEQRVPTISGLAYFLGFLSRQSIYDYKDRNKDQESAYIIKRTTLYIESLWEEELYRSQGHAGIIFWLKNKGWSDKQEIEQTITEYKIKPPPEPEEAYDD